MAMQARRNVDNTPFVLSGSTTVRESETIAQDVGRVAVLAPKTVMAREEGTTKWVPLTEVDPAGTPAVLTCGALGTTLAGFQAVTDGEFAITVDSEAMDITGIDFSDIDAPTDTPATLTCGANGAIIAAGWNAVADGQFGITVAGVTTQVGPCDFNTVAVTTFEEVAGVINEQLAGLGVRCEYDRGDDNFLFVSIATGRLATMTVLTAGTAGTDISGAGYLNGAVGVGVVVNGTGGIGATLESVLEEAAAGRFGVDWDAAGNAMIFTSPTTGQEAAITVLSAVAGGAGTDISGAGFLNGLVGTGVVTATAGFTSENTVAGIYVGEEITAAALVAADVVHCPIIVAGTGATIASGQIVLEGGLVLTDVIPSQHQTIFDALVKIGLVPELTIDIAGYENT